MSQNELRKRIKHLHDCLGMPYTMVAKYCDLSGGYICLWIQGNKNLSKEKFEQVEEFYNEIRKEVLKHND